MTSGSAAGLAAAWLAACAPACAVDDRVLEIAPDAILLGTYENDTPQSDDARFGPWSTSSWSSDSVSLNLSIVRDGCWNSRWCLSLDWALQDPADGIASSAGVFDFVAPLSPIDISSFTRIVFTHQFVHQGTCQSAGDLRIAVSCGGPSPAVLQASVRLSPNWVTQAVWFSALSPAGQPPADVQGQDCLKAVTGIRFEMPVDLPDGQCATGALLLDDVIIR